ncbi:MAG: tetratricopeptide repeat protein [Aggregatilineales bacterium]
MQRLGGLIFLCVLLASCVGYSATRNNDGNRSYQNEDFEQALRAYQSAQVESPNDPVAYYNAASAYLAVNDLDQARAALEQALVTADEALTAEAYHNLGNVYFFMADYQSAILAFRESLLLRPDDEDTRFNLELAIQRYVPPTATAIEQQTEPEQGQSDPEVTPTDNPGGFDGPSPTPPPQEAPPDPSETPVAGDAATDGVQSSTALPRSDGEMTIEDAELLLDSVEQDQETLTEYLEDESTSGEPIEKDW